MDGTPARVAMWVSQLSAVTFSGDAVLRPTGPDPLRRAVLSVLREAPGAGASGDPERAWSGYAASRAGARWGEQREVLLGDLFRGLPAEALRGAEAAVGDRLGAALEWQADALPALDYLRESGLSTALILDLPAPLPPAWLERARPWFDTVVSSRDLGFRTPAATVFADAVVHMHVPAARVLHVGEGLAEDVRGAQRAGLRAALLERPMRHPQDPQALDWLLRTEGRAAAEVKPDLKIRTLEELAAAIDAFG